MNSPADQSTAKSSFSLSTLVHPDLLLVLVTMLAAISWMFSKEALAQMPPLMFVGARFLLAGLLLALIGHKAVRRLNAQQWRQASLVGFSFSLAMCVWIMGLFHAEHLGEGAFITSLAVVLVPLINALLFKQKPAASTWPALALAVLGMMLLSLQGGFQVEASQGYFLAAALLFSITFIFNSRASAQVPSLPLAAIQLAQVGLVAFPLSFLLESWPVFSLNAWLQAFSGDIWWWLALSVLVGTALRFLLQTHAQGLTSASHAAVIMLLEPVWTALVASLWFGEQMAALQWLGCGLIFIALLVNRASALRTWLRARG